MDTDVSVQVLQRSLLECRQFAFAIGPNHRFGPVQYGFNGFERKIATPYLRHFTFSEYLAQIGEEEYAIETFFNSPLPL